MLKVHCDDEYQGLDYSGRSYPGVEIPVGPFTEKVGVQYVDVGDLYLIHKRPRKPAKANPI